MKKSLIIVSSVAAFFILVSIGLSITAILLAYSPKGDDNSAEGSVPEYNILGKWVYDADEGMYFILFGNGTVYVNNNSSLGSLHISVSNGGEYVLTGPYFLAKGDSNKLFEYKLEGNKLTLTSERGTVYSYTKSE